MKAVILVPALAVFVLMACCSSGDGALSGRAYVSEIPRDQICGHWVPLPPGPSLGQVLRSLFSKSSSAERRMLEINADGTCTISPEFVRFIIQCEQVRPSARPNKGGCIWRVEGQPGEQGIVAVFEGPDKAWLATNFSVYRQVARGDLSLVGTCGWGDAYGLYRPPAQGVSSR